jgi:lambda family phage tail tape measure protein
MSLIARLGVYLGINTSEFLKGMDDATGKTREFVYQQKKQMREWDNAVSDAFTRVGIAATIATAALAKTFQKAGDEYDDLAKAFDITVESVITTKTALQGAGGDAEDASTMFQKLANAQDAAREGNDQMRKSFERLGISGAEVDRLKLDELFKRVASGLTEARSASERLALGQDLLGKAVKTVNWDDFVDKYKEFKDPELVKAIEDNAAAWDNIEKAMKNIGLMMQKLAQPFATWINSTAEFGKELDKIQKQSLSAAQALEAHQNLMLKDLNLPSRKKESFVGQSFPQNAGGIADIDAGYKKLSDKELAAQKSAAEKRERDAEKAAEKRKKEAEKAKELEEDFQELLAKAYDRQAKYNAQLKEMFELHKINSQLMENDFNNQKQLLDLEGERYKISENEYNVRKLNIDQAQKLKDIEQRATEAKAVALAEFERASSEEQVRAKEIYDAKIYYIELELEIRKGYSEQLNQMEDDNLQKSIERQKSWSAGWSEAMKEYTETAEKASLRGRAAFESVTSNMETAIRRFVDTGKFAFKDFVGSVIKDLLVMEMRAQASMVLRSIMSSFSGMPTGGGGANPSANLIMSGVGKKASGGRIDSPTIVGENGAELFVPQTSGTVIPNGSWQQMAAAGGGNNGITVNGNYIANMSAIDTQSATQFLAANKNAIWASYQSANRSVPISR